jgi:hypothetical protein
MRDDDWDADDRDEEDWDDDSCGGEDDPTDTMSCPNCNAEIYEDAEQCPVCGVYVVRHISTWSGKPLWWIALAVAGILATIATMSLLVGP